VVTACERAVRFAIDAERPERLLGLGRLYSGLETALCGACGYRPGRGDACEAMIDFARLESDSFARRNGRPGFAYTGREFRTVLEHWPADSSAEAARVALDALPKLEAGLPEAECRALERQALVDACPPTSPAYSSRRGGFTFSSCTTGSARTSSASQAARHSRHKQSPASSSSRR
jgi:hypothetical protein